jgi:hypothetical protein
MIAGHHGRNCPIASFAAEQQHAAISVKIMDSID